MDRTPIDLYPPPTAEIPSTPNSQGWSRDRLMDLIGAVIHRNVNYVERSKCTGIADSILREMAAKGLKIASTKPSR